MSPLLTSTFKPTFKLIVLPALSAVSRAPPRPPLLALSARLADLRSWWCVVQTNARSEPSAVEGQRRVLKIEMRSVASDLCGICWMLMTEMTLRFFDTLPLALRCVDAHARCVAAQAGHGRAAGAGVASDERRRVGDGARAGRAAARVVEHSGRLTCHDPQLESRRGRAERSTVVSP